MKVLCPGKGCQILIKEKSGLCENEDLLERLIQSTFQEKTDFLDQGSMLLLKNHYAAYYWQLQKDFLDYLDDSMPQDSLI
jgi:hypothetical protein